VVGIFPNEASILRLIGAILAEQNDEWTLQNRYLTLERHDERAGGRTLWGAVGASAQAAFTDKIASAGKQPELEQLAPAQFRCENTAVFLDG
jgi:hypothetical protein